LADADDILIRTLFPICRLSLPSITTQCLGILNREMRWLEFCSNSSDALDKLRFLSVTDPSLLEANPNLEIRIKADHDAGTITIT
jgi:hypothetical protein